MQSLTIKIRIFPKKSEHLRELSHAYIRVVNQLTTEAEQTGNFPKVTTKDVDAPLPSAVLNQAIRDAKSVYRKAKKLGKRPILKKPVYYVNNQNYSITDQILSFPILIDGKVKKTKFKALITDRDQRILKHSKLGLLRLAQKSGKWYAQISLEVQAEKNPSSTVEMGVDLISA